MSIQEIQVQKQALIEAGYTYKYSGNMHEWLSPSGEMVASEYKSALAIGLAYSKMQETAAAPVADSDTRIAELEAQAKNDAAYVARLEQERTEANEAIAGLHTQLQKAQAALTAAQAIIVQAGQDFEALRNENTRVKGLLENIGKMANGLETDCARTESEYDLAMTRGLSARVAEIEAWAKQGKSIAPAPQAPATKKSSTMANRCRVNWNQRGFSSGSYEVLGYSQEKQVYILNISSDPDRPMPKAFRMADCAVQS